MFKIMAFLTRREDIETRAFIEYYETRHVPLIRSLAPTPIGYRRSYLVRGDELNIEGDEIGFDVVTELVFPEPQRVSRLEDGRSPRPARASRSSPTTRRGSSIAPARRRTSWRSMSRPIPRLRAEAPEILPAMLILLPNCECCDRDLPPESDQARICTYECTFCADCAENRFATSARTAAAISSAARSARRRSC